MQLLSICGYLPESDFGFYLHFVIPLSASIPGVFHLWAQSSSRTRTHRVSKESHQKTPRESLAPRSTQTVRQFQSEKFSRLRRKVWVSRVSKTLLVMLLLRLATPYGDTPSNQQVPPLPVHPFSFSSFPCIFCSLIPSSSLDFRTCTAHHSKTNFSCHHTHRTRGTNS